MDQFIRGAGRDEDLTGVSGGNYDEVSAEPANDKLSIARVRVERALSQLLRLLRPMLNKDVDEVALTQLVLTSAFFEEPLSQHEIIVLGCALYARKSGEALNYTDVLKITHQVRGQAMSVPLVYRTVNKLAERKILKNTGRRIDPETGRPSSVFEVTEAGLTAFHLAVINAEHLKTMRGQAAA